MTSFPGQFVGVSYDDGRVVSVGRDVRETIRDVFGKDSPEFEDAKRRK